MKDNVGFPSKQVGSKQAPKQDQGMAEKSAVSPTHPGPTITKPSWIKTEEVKGTDIGKCCGK